MWTHVGSYTLTISCRTLQQACLVCGLLYCGFAYSQSYLCRTTQQATSVHVRHSITTYTLTVYRTIYRTTCCPHVCIMSGRVDVCAHEETEDKKKTRVISLFMQGTNFVLNYCHSTVRVILACGIILVQSFFRSRDVWRHSVPEHFKHCQAAIFDAAISVFLTCECSGRVVRIPLIPAKRAFSFHLRSSSQWIQ